MPNAKDTPADKAQAPELWDANDLARYSKGVPQLGLPAR